MTIDSTTFVHFNDVYNVEKSPPFVAAVKRARSRLMLEEDRDVITVFGGDAFSPSIVSTVPRGEQMVPVPERAGDRRRLSGQSRVRLRYTRIPRAERAVQLSLDLFECIRCRGREAFGWMPRVRRRGQKRGRGAEDIDGRPRRKGLDGHSFVRGSFRVVFEEPIDFVKRRIPELKEELGPFDAVVALAHMRMPNNIAVAKEAPPGLLDIILGGHDHHYECRVEDGIPILNSGADFATFSTVEVKGRNEALRLETASVRVNMEPDDEPDEEVLEVVQKFKDEVYRSMDVVVGRTKARLDARESEIRTKETNVSNFLAELLTRSTGADIALFNAGTIRADRFIEK